MIKRLSGPGVLLILIITVSITLVYQDYQRFLKTPLPLEQVLIFTIDPGMSFADVNSELSTLGLIEKNRYFEFLARETGMAGQLKSGEYRLQVGLNPVELLELFVSGKVLQYSFTLLAGWDIRDMLAMIKESSLLVNTLANDDPEQLMMALGYDEKSPEGLFFADTYYFPKGTTDQAFLKRAYARLQKILNEEWLSRTDDLPYQTPYQALSMASIIEKETGLDSERKTIAGVFIRRLNKNMKLQTDPTVIYAMGEQFDGNIRKKDLHIDSPYNTYRYKGLPPGPIALVGRAAIHAALHPETGESLYFVSKGDGSHYFSKTLTEHNRAVAKYQLNKSINNQGNR